VDEIYQDIPNLHVRQKQLRILPKKQPKENKISKS